MNCRSAIFAAKMAALQSSPSWRFQFVSRRIEIAPLIVPEKMKFFCGALVLVLSAAILEAADEKSGNAPIISEIRAVLRVQQEAWNRGDIDSFMNGYARADTTVFVSGDEVVRGWQTVRDGYLKTYSDAANTGTLTFAELPS